MERKATSSGGRLCAESLRNDVAGVNAGLKELLCTVGDLQTPSWRFPERLAASLDMEGLLKDAAAEPAPQTGEADCSSTRVLLLELLVDRSV